MMTRERREGKGGKLSYVGWLCLEARRFYVGTLCSKASMRLFRSIIRVPPRASPNRSFV